MSKLLKDVTDYLKETQGLSMSQISKDLGKGRNYIREAIERDISMDNQMEILHKMYCRGLGYKDLFAIIQQQATKYHFAQEQANEFERQLISVNEENRKLEKHCTSLKTTLEHRNKGLSESQRQIKAKDLAIDSLNRGANNRLDMYNLATEKNKELEHQIVVLQKKIDEDQKEYVKGEVAQDNQIDHLTHLLNDSQNTIASMEKSQKEMTKAGQGIAGQLSAMTGSRNMWCLLFILAVLFSCVLMYHAF